MYAAVSQDDVAEHKVYVRKLEARLDDLKNAADISSRYQAAKQKVGSLFTIKSVLHSGC